MSLDTTSPLLGLLLMGTGNDNNAWGDNHNNNVTLLIEQAIAGRTDVTGMTGGPVTLTANQMRSRLVVISGTLTSNLVLTLPGTSRVTKFINICGGDFTVTVNAGGVNVENLPLGKWVEIQIFGNELGRVDVHEVGELFYYAGLAAPAGSMECTGAALKRASYPSLYAKIGTTYGNNDVTDFKLPDGYTAGKFLRSRTAALTIGTAQTSQNKSHTHTGSGTTSGISADHNHTGSGTTSGQSATHTHTGSGTTAIQSADHSHTGSGTTSGANIDHTHTGSGTTAIQSADHTHTGSGTTSGQSATHTHAGTSDGASISMSHSHTVSGTTGTESAAHTHSYTGATNTTTAVAAAGHAFGDSVAGTTGTESATHTHSWSGTSSSTDLAHTHTFTTGNASLDHSHTYSFTTSGISANHTHIFSLTTGGASLDHSHTYSFTTSGISANHTHIFSLTTAVGSADHSHTFSFTTSGVNADHTHTYSFTTSDGSADGTEARPESLVAMLCIRY